MYHSEAEAVEAWNQRYFAGQGHAIRIADSDHVWIGGQQYISLDRANKMIEEKAVYCDELEANWEYFLQNVIKSAGKKACEALLKGETDG